MEAEVGLRSGLEGSAVIAATQPDNMMGQSGRMTGEIYTADDDGGMGQDQAGMSGCGSIVPGQKKYQYHRYRSLTKKRIWEASSGSVEGELPDV